jgi:sporulation protein YlmC with PRC-barrel domain
MEKFLDIVRNVLDHEVVDVNDVPCGMVDDVELEGSPGGELKVTALVVGAGAWEDRLPWVFGTLAKKIFGRQRTRVPWDEVWIVGERIKLKSRASEVNLGRADVRASKLVGRLPGSG